jgi:hypothetical protein
MPRKNNRNSNQAPKNRGRRSAKPSKGRSQNGYDQPRRRDEDGPLRTRSEQRTPVLSFDLDY